MKIIRLQSSNIMRLVAVDVTPKGDLVIVGGKNGAGKSSVLNSIAMALGGAALAPEEPIRAGESKAQIELDLGEFKVTRKFSRTRIGEGMMPDGQGGETPIIPSRPIWGETSSSLIVTNKDGAVYPSPQKMLDTLLGKLTFDPLAFSKEGETAEGRQRQAQILRRLVGLDFTLIEAKARVAYEERTMLKKTLAIKEAQLLKMPVHPDAVEEIPLATVNQELQDAELARKAAEQANENVRKTKELQEKCEAQKKNIDEIIEEQKRQLRHLEERRAVVVDASLALDKELSLVEENARKAHALVPDVKAILERLTHVEQHNVKVRDNRAQAAVTAEATELAREITIRTDAIAAAEKAKADQLKAAKFPVDGLSLGDSGVTLNGLPFSQASSAEQLRVSVAIGLALNPKLKVLLIRSGNLLDDDSLKLVASQAEAADAQVWMEYVTANPEGVSVMIEDGRAADGPVT